MMDFEEWLRKHEREVFKRNQGCFDKAYIFGAKNGFKAGQQSKQAEIDKIKQLLKQWDDWISVSDGNNHIDIVKECADELRELLK